LSSSTTRSSSLRPGTTYGRSSLHVELKDRSSGVSRRYSSSQEWSRAKDDSKRGDSRKDSERLEYHATGGSDHTSCERERRDYHQSKYNSLDRSSVPLRRTRQQERLEQSGRSADVVDCKRSEEDTKSMKLSEDLDNLSVTGKKDSLKDYEDKTSEYKPVLTRHVNQLFIRGDNVALVAILR